MTRQSRRDSSEPVGYKFFRHFLITLGIKLSNPSALSPNDDNSVIKSELWSKLSSVLLVGLSEMIKKLPQTEF